MNNTPLPTGFVSIEECLELLNGHTLEEPTVDIKFLIRNVDYLRPKGNLTMKLVKRNAQGGLVEAGVTYIQPASSYEVTIVRHAIEEAASRVMGRQIKLDQARIYKKTTTVDTEKNIKGRVMTNPDSDTQVGTEMSAGLLGVN